MEPLSRDEVAAAFSGIAKELERIETLIYEASESSTPALTEFSTYLTSAGGKRFRPAMMVLTSKLGDGASEDVLMTAAAMEMTHLATLYHDDVIDEAGTRRGVPSANEKWGDKVAILAGDYLFTKAAGLAARVGGEVPGVLADAISRVVQGQVDELEMTFDPRRSVSHYFKTIEGKTASLLEASTYLGARLGGCSDEECASARRFGTAMGFAFQIADDLLDLAADVVETGKPHGTDLKEGVYTLPVIYAVEAEPKVASLLGESSVEVEAVRKLVSSTGAFAKAVATAEHYVAEALTELDSFRELESKQVLVRLTRLIVERVPALEA